MRTGTIGRVAAMGLLVVATACSKGGAASGSTPPPTSTAARPASTAKIRIVEPTNGQTFPHAPATIHVKVDLKGARIVPATTQHITPDTGHLHVFVDNQIVSMNFSTTDTVGNVKAGQHILRVEFVASDHLPFNPRVIQEVTFEVK